MKNANRLVGTALLALAVLGVSAGLTWANHVRTEGEVTLPVAPSPTAAPATLQAGEIKAELVRANTIYANEIDADQVQGVIYQTDGVKVKSSAGDIKAPQVSASVIYADEIKANSVVADAIYVRKLNKR